MCIRDRFPTVVAGVGIAVIGVCPGQENPVFPSKASTSLFCALAGAASARAIAAPEATLKSQQASLDLECAPIFLVLDFVIDIKVLVIRSPICVLNIGHHFKNLPN